MIIKVDSGPGRDNIELLARLRVQGFLLYPGVPNTTAVTQETDRSYGMFKNLFRCNLERLTNDRLAEGLSVSFNQSIIGLLVFGSGSNYVDAFAEAFSHERNKAAWEAVGAVPLTMKCVESEMVRQDSINDPLHEVHKRIEENNTVACHLLQSMGFDSSGLRTKLQHMRKKSIELTKPNSVETVKKVADAKSLPWEAAT